MHKVELYETVGGKCSVKDLLNDLPDKLAAKVICDIDLLQQFGLELGAPYIKSLHGSEMPKLFELRTKLASNIVRVLFFTLVGSHYVLLSGFVKKTDETPVNELHRARRFLNDYLRRYS